MSTDLKGILERSRDLAIDKREQTTFSTGVDREARDDLRAAWKVIDSMALELLDLRQRLRQAENSADPRQRSAF